MIKHFLHPVVLINLMTVGFLVFVGVLHEQTHRALEVDVHGYVRQYCRNNPDACIKMSSD